MKHPVDSQNALSIPNPLWLNFAYRLVFHGGGVEAPSEFLDTHPFLLAAGSFLVYDKGTLMHCNRHYIPSKAMF